MSKSRIALILVLATGCSLLAGVAALRAQVGPSSSGGVGYGAIATDGSFNVAIGTSTTATDTKFFVRASSSAATAYAIRVLQPAGGSTLFSLRNDGTVAFSGAVTAASFTGSFAGTTSAGNVSAGAFGANTGGGNYSFPGSVGIGIPSPTTPLSIAVNGSGSGFNVLGPSGNLLFQSGGVNGAGLISQNNNSSNGFVIGTESGGASTAAGRFLRLQTSGADRLVIDNGGSVGIGTASPNAKLEVQGSDSAGNPTLRVSRPTSGATIAPYSKLELANQYVNSGDTTGGVEFTNLAASNTYAAVRAVSRSAFGAFTDADLQFFTLGSSSLSPKMTILGNGNVGIGQVNPGFKLEVMGTIFSSSGGFRFPDGTTQTTAATGGGSGTITGVTAGTGLSGGGTSGTVTLTNSDPGSAQLIFRTIADAAGTGQFSATTSTDVLRFEGAGGTTVSFTPATKKVTITSSAASTISAGNVSSAAFGANTGGGNYSFPASVGIGTTAPDANARLHVQTSSAVSRILAETTNATGYAELSMQGTGRLWNLGVGGASETSFGVPNKFFIHDNNQNAMRLVIDTAGNVGIGTANPGTKLSVSSATGVTDSLPALGANGGKLSLLNNGGLYGLLQGVLSTGDAFLQAQRVDGAATAFNMLLQPNGGNVGVGTTTPAQKLTVVGTIFSSSGGFRFPDGTTQTTAAAGGASTMSAANVSSAAFGANTGGGNYSFPANLSLGTASVDLAGFGANAGRVLTLQGSTQRSVLELSNAAAGSNGVAGQLAFENGSTQVAALLGATDGATNSGYVAIYTNSAGTFAERVRVDRNGNVGIGQTNPASYKLDVAGTVRSSSGGFVFPDGTTQTTAATGGASTMSATNVSSGAFGANTGGGNYSFPASMGIGIAAPTAKLHVYGDGTFAGGFRLQYSGSASPWALAQGTDGKFYLGYGAAGSESTRLVVDTAGSVGIGMNSPPSVLSVDGDDDSGAITAYSTQANDAFSILPWVGNTLLSSGVYFKDSAWVHDANDGNNAIFTIDPGVGTTWHSSNNSAPSWNVANSVTLWNNSGRWAAGIQSTQAVDSYITGGNLGVGTTGPGGKLSVVGTSGAASSIEQHILNNTASGYQALRLGTDAVAATGAALSYYNSSWSTSGADTANGAALYSFGSGGLNLAAYDASGVIRFYSGGNAAGNERMRIAANGNVGIGQVNPASYKLEVAGTIFSSSGGFRFPDGTTQTTAATGGASTMSATNISSGAFGANTGGGNYTFPGTLGASGVITSSGGGANIGTHPTYGSTYAAFWKTGADYALLADTTDTYINAPGASGAIAFRRQNSELMRLDGTTLTIGGGTGKLNVGTIDPIYKINGKKFATYVPGIIGVKEEISGVLTLSCSAGRCARTIDFASEPEGSDLWLFGKTTDIRRHLPQAAVQLTPAFEGRAWYAKDAARGRLTVTAVSAGSERTVEVSYRITAPRFDAAQWSNRATDDVEGFVIED